MNKKRSPLGNFLRNARLHNKLTLNQVRDATKLSQGYLSDLEAGNSNGRNPSLSTLKALAKLYGLPMAQWLRL